MSGRSLLASALRYGAAGVVNTAVGLGLTLGLELGLGVQANIANAAGYVAGVCVSFVLSRLFVFGRERPLTSAGPRYLVAVASAFLLNQAVLTIARTLLPDGDLMAVLAQCAGMVSYTGALFLLSHYWVFASGTGPRRPWIDWAVALTAMTAGALVLMASALPHGLTAGDGHVYNSLWVPEFIKATARGEIAPRWLPGANLGLGAPSFYYYPPLAFYVANLVDGLSGGMLSNDQIVAWTSLAMLGLSGVAMYAWLRSQAGQVLAVAGGLLYMAAPYHLINIYVRGALAETSAYMALPLVLLGLTRAAAGWRGIALLAVGYMLLICGHIATALLATVTVIPIYVAGLAWAAPPAERLRVLRNTLAGGVLGLALSAFYLAPALLMQADARVSYMWGALGAEKWTLLHPGQWPVPQLAGSLAELAVATAAGALIALLAGWGGRLFRPVAALCLSVALAFALYATATPWTAPGIGDLLSTVQFPWRILSIMDVAAISALAFAATDAVARPGRRRLWLLLVAPLLLLPLDALRPQKAIMAAVVTPEAEIPWARRQIAIRRAPDEHLPPGLRLLGDDASALIERLAQEPAVQAVDPRASLSSISEGKDGSLRAVVEAPTATTLVARRFYFRAWQATTPGGKTLTTRPHGGEQRLAVDVPAGRTALTLRIGRTPVERIGDAITLAALAALGVLAARSLRRKQPAQTA